MTEIETYGISHALLLRPRSHLPRRPWGLQNLRPLAIIRRPQYFHYLWLVLWLSLPGSVTIYHCVVLWLSMGGYVAGSAWFYG